MDSRDRTLLEQADELDREMSLALGNFSDTPATEWVQILGRNGVEFRGQAALETRDHVVSCIVGVVGGVLDLTKSFQGAMTNEAVHKRFDSLSKDYLGRVTGLDGIAAIDNARGGGRAHRLIGPAHDLARFFEAIGQIVGGQFRSNFGGVEKVVSRYAPRSAEYLKVDNPVDAAIVLILHLVGDFFSAQSLPIPGRTANAERHDPEIYRRIVREFLAGGNLREQVATFLNNLSGTVLISIVLRLYRYFVLFVVERQPMELHCLKLADDVLYHLMQRDAQTIAFVISLGKAAFIVNPIDVNYTSFVQIVRSGAAVNRLSEAEHQLLQADFARIEQEIEEL